MAQDKESIHPENSPVPGSNSHPYFSEYRAGVRDEFLGVKIKSVLLKTEKNIVFLDDSTNLHWDCATKTEIRRCYPEVANRVASLEARSEFLRRVNSNSFLRRPSTPEDLTDLTNARLLISLAIIQVLVDPKNPDRAKHADAVLDTAEAWILQRATETSRVWYFHPFMAVDSYLRVCPIRWTMFLARSFFKS